MYQTNQEILDMMETCRLICSLGNKLRHEHNLPNRLPLKELQYSGTLLFSYYNDLIKYDVNVERVNPFICKGEFENLYKMNIKWWERLVRFFWKQYDSKLRKKYSSILGENWVEITEKGIKVSLNIHLDDWQKLEEQKSKERREEIMKRKMFIK